MDEIQEQIEAVDWLQTWLYVRQAGIITELAESLRNNKFAEVCRVFGVPVDDIMYKRARIYKLMKKFNHLILSKIPITLWETHIGALEKFFDDPDNAMEHQFWSVYRCALRNLGGESYSPVGVTHIY
jgi:hypothetical protein